MAPCRTCQIELIMITPTSTRFAWFVAYTMFASVIGDDECRMSRSVDARRLGAGLGSPDRVVGCEVGRKTFKRDCSHDSEKYMGACIATRKRMTLHSKVLDMSN